MCLYLSLSSLHISDSFVHHQERRFGAVYRNCYKPVRLAVALADATLLFLFSQQFFISIHLCHAVKISQYIAVFVEYTRPVRQTNLSYLNDCLLSY